MKPSQAIVDSKAIFGFANFLGYSHPTYKTHAETIKINGIRSLSACEKMWRNSIVSAPFITWPECQTICPTPNAYKVRMKTLNCNKNAINVFYEVQRQQQCYNHNNNKQLQWSCGRRVVSEWRTYEWRLSLWTQRTDIGCGTILHKWIKIIYYYYYLSPFMKCGKRFGWSSDEVAKGQRLMNKRRARNKNL